MKKVGIIALLVMVGLGLLLSFPPDPLLRALFNLERARHGVAHQSVNVDGETWHYLEGGAEGAETVLLLHGFGADKDNWMRYAAHLVDDYRVIAPDLPGWGESARHADRDYRLPEQLPRLRRFTEVLELERMHLAGNSMGGHLAALYAEAYPQQLLSLGLFNAAGVKEPRPSEMTRAIARGESPLVIDTVEDYDRLLAFVAVEPPFIPPPAKRYLARRALANRDFNARIFQALIRDPRTALEPRLAGIATATLVLWGDTDRLLDVSMTEVYAAGLPNARVVVMDQTGHLPMVERPEASAAIHRQFMEQLR